jgi:hypothetical protein
LTAENDPQIKPFEKKGPELEIITLTEFKASRLLVNNLRKYMNCQHKHKINQHEIFSVFICKKGKGYDDVYKDMYVQYVC